MLVYYSNQMYIIINEVVICLKREKEVICLHQQHSYGGSMVSTTGSATHHISDHWAAMAVHRSAPYHIPPAATLLVWASEKMVHWTLTKLEPRYFIYYSVVKMESHLGGAPGCRVTLGASLYKQDLKGPPESSIVQPGKPSERNYENPFLLLRGS